MSSMSRIGYRAKAELHHFFGNDRGVADALISHAADEIRPLVAAYSGKDLVHTDAGRIKKEFQLEIFQSNAAVDFFTIQQSLASNKKMQALAQECLARGMSLTIRTNESPFRYSSDPVGQVVEKLWPVFNGNKEDVAHNFADYAVHVLRYRTLKALSGLSERGTDVAKINHVIPINGVKLRVPEPGSVDDRLLTIQVAKEARSLREEVADTFHVDMKVEMRPIQSASTPVRRTSLDGVAKPMVAVATLRPLSHLAA